MRSKFVICKKCGWVHFHVTADYVRDWKRQWDIDWKKMTSKSRENYGLKDGPPTTDSYLRCFRCSGDYKNFRLATKRDLTDMRGSTIQPILYFKETL